LSTARPALSSISPGSTKISPGIILKVIGDW
jgi:hypothetical protein